MGTACLVFLNKEARCEGKDVASGPITVETSLVECCGFLVKSARGQYNSIGQASITIGRSSKPFRTYVLIHCEETTGRESYFLKKKMTPNPLHGSTFLTRMSFKDICSIGRLCWKKASPRACTIHTLTNSISMIFFGAFPWVNLILIE